MSNRTPPSRTPNARTFASGNVPCSFFFSHIPSRAYSFRLSAWFLSNLLDSTLDLLWPLSRSVVLKLVRACNLAAAAEVRSEESARVVCENPVKLPAALCVARIDLMSSVSFLRRRQNFNPSVTCHWAGRRVVPAINEKGPFSFLSSNFDLKIIVADIARFWLKTIIGKIIFLFKSSHDAAREFCHAAVAHNGVLKNSHSDKDPR